MIYGDEFKKLYKRPEIVLNNLERVYKLCSEEDKIEGKSWYANANSFSLYLSDRYKVDPIKTAGIISALSPQKEWEHNKILAEEAISTDGRIIRHTSQQANKAKRILKNSRTIEDVDLILGGLKTINFFHNIREPTLRDYVTVDRHHLYLSIGRDARDCTPKQYEFLKQNTVIFANGLDLLPNELQSTLWVCWRRIKREQDVDSS